MTRLGSERSAASVLGCVFVALLSTNGCAASPVRDLAFQPPPHWFPTPTINGEQFWIDPTNLYQTILIIRPAERLDAEPLSLKYLKNGRVMVSGASFVRKRENIVICGNQRVVFYSMRMRFSRQPSDIDAIYTLSNGEWVSAWYARPQGAIPLPAAEAAIRSICVARR